MRKLHLVTLPVLGALAAACSLAAATAQADNTKTEPTAQTLAPTAVTVASAELQGTVYAGRQKTTYWFEIGPTTAYGASTQADTTNKNEPVAVQSSVSGLAQGTTYHARLVARNDDGLSLGADTTFTTTSAIPTPAALSPLRAGGSRPDSDADDDASAPVLAPAAPPELGQSVGVDAQSGSVLVRLPGSSRAVALTDAASVPVGSVLDARKGTVTLSSALPGGDSQTGTFHGGLFEIRQPASRR